MLSLEDVLARLRDYQLRPSGTGQWRARCPVHQADGRPHPSPSLSVAAGAGDRALIFCHRGCSYMQIREALFGPGQPFMHGRPLHERDDGGDDEGDLLLYLANARALELHRQRWRHPDVRLAYALADHRRLCYQLAAHLQDVATLIGNPSDETLWSLVGVATVYEREGLLLDAMLDAASPPIANANGYDEPGAG